MHAAFAAVNAAGVVTGGVGGAEAADVDAGRVVAGWWVVVAADYLDVVGHGFGVVLGIGGRY